MKAAFHKINIDFEYLKEIYTIDSDPYKTLSELKETVSKKIFPCPGDVHCFYKNVDLFEKEDEEIIKLFPHNSKIKIKLKKPSKENRLQKRSVILRNIKPNFIISETEETQNYPKIDANVSPLKKAQTMRKQKIIRLMTLPSTTDTRPSSKQNHKIQEETLNDNIKNNELYNFFHKKEINKDKTSKKSLIQDSDRNFKNLLNKYKGSKNQTFLTDKKENLNFLLSSLKGKNLNKVKFNNNINFSYGKSKSLKDKILKEDKTPSKIRLKKLNITNEEKEDMNESISNNNDNNVNKEMIDENYVCPSCKEEMISEYCINCNLFKCNTCIENCKDEQHEHLKIDLDGKRNNNFW